MWWPESMRDVQVQGCPIARTKRIERRPDDLYNARRRKEREERSTGVFRLTNKRNGMPLTL